MKFAALFAAAAALASALPLQRREVPQEHSHDLIVNAVRTISQKGGNKDPLLGVDPVFGPLGTQAQITQINKTPGLSAEQKDDKCLQQNLADLCVTNAKKNGNNKNEIAVCMQFRVLERNSGSVGGAQATCTKTPANAELAGLTQLQDPASAEGKSGNAGIQTQLAKNLLKLGFTADEAASLALQTSTFGPGQIGDNTARGLSCDNNPVTADRDGDFFGRAIKKGQQIDCITQATLEGSTSKAVPSISKADLIAALGGADSGSSGSGSTGTATTDSGEAQTASPVTTTVTVTVTVTDSSACATDAPTSGNDETDTQPTATDGTSAETTTADTDGGMDGSGTDGSETDGSGTDGTDGSTGSTGNIDFGVCKEPTIEFGVGFDGRKETAFRPVNSDSFSHGSAQNIGVITGFICDRFRDNCKAPQATQDLCTQAQAAANGAAAKTGAQADAFNAAFGITTTFAGVTPVSP
ncbi:hypothetical protein HK105_205838 [Polyrhizophydium stewartii]|uniref:Uncharacterized protein n=1 Tax=Polyrhizophydium stewartii TaxID=2732419 RepID=A0ABR4N5D1_9FUNG